METTLQFSEHYQDRVCLPGGERVLLRLVRPSDKEQLRDGFHNLSAPSRYKRFLAGKDSISEEELRYFTELDHLDHFALGVVELDEYGEEGDGVGIGRFVRLSADAECAEVALTVIDRMQGKGIGRILLEQLVAAAAERDIKRFRFECLSQNLEMQKLVQNVCRVVDVENDAGVMIVESDLPGKHLGSYKRSLDAFDHLFDLLRAFAAHTLELQFSIGLEAVHRTLDSAFDRRDNRHGNREDSAT